jgi:phosphoserine phosphatase
MKKYQFSWIQTDPTSVQSWIDWVSHHLQSTAGKLIGNLKTTQITDPEPAELLSITIEFSDEPCELSFRKRIWSDLLNRTCPTGQPQAVSIIPQAVADADKKLFAFDFDSTLINEETIDELARILGFYEPVSKITEAAMQGKMNFEEALRSRCQLLAGLKLTQAEPVMKKLNVTVGALPLLKFLKAKSATTAIVSGGFHFVLQPFQNLHGFDSIFANQLELTSEGTFTGKVTGKIVDGVAKKDRIAELKKQHHYPTEAVVCIGDGSNDIPMMTEAGISVSFCGKPALTLVCNTWILNRNLLWIKSIL